MAEKVNMASINMENFFSLCGELFHGGITRERIVALFTFVGDVAVHQVRHRGEQFLSVLLKWSFRYLVDHICKWVQEAGGWGVVLNQGMNFIYKSVVFMCCLVGTVAGGVYIWKSLKEM
nr:Bcl2 protein [Penaeus vannamei]